MEQVWVISHTKRNRLEGTLIRSAKDGSGATKCVSTYQVTYVKNEG
jgi:hypothetical protein